MGYVRAGLGAAFNASQYGVKPSGGTYTGGKDPAPGKITVRKAIELGNARAYARLSPTAKGLLGDKPVDKLLAIFAPQMPMVIDTAEFALDFLGPAAGGIRIGGKSLKDLRPSSSSDPYLKSLKATLVFSILAAGPCGLGLGPLAYGLGKALVKRGRWPQARLDLIGQRVTRVIAAGMGDAAKNARRILASIPMPNFNAPTPPSPQQLQQAAQDVASKFGVRISGLGHYLSGLGETYSYQDENGNMVFVQEEEQPMPPMDEPGAEPGGTSGEQNPDDPPAVGNDAKDATEQAGVKDQAKAGKAAVNSPGFATEVNNMIKTLLLFGKVAEAADKAGVKIPGVTTTGNTPAGGGDKKDPGADAAALKAYLEASTASGKSNLPMILGAAALLAGGAYVVSKKRKARG